VPAKTLICILLFTFAASTAAAQRRQFHYEPEQVKLIGKLVQKTFYGPPNYGESPKTDSREHQYILILDSPIDVAGNAENETENRIREITLVVHDFKANPVRPWLSRRVAVEGTLFHAITGHHHTKILITVSSIRTAKRGERL
jgi:hypothetical protein